MAQSLTPSDEDDLARKVWNSAHIEVGHGGCYSFEARLHEQVGNERREQEEEREKGDRKNSRARKRVKERVLQEGCVSC